MKKNLLTKHCALLLLALATAWSTQAWAGIKIYVRTEGSAAGTAPNLYVWNQSREPINGAWPGTQMSETTTTSDGTSWYVKEFNATNIGVIINNYNGQTPDLEGINEDRYYSYKGGSEYYNLTNQYVIPGNATYIEGKKFIYFVNTSEWGTPHAHVYNSNGNITGSWPGETMTKVDNTVNLWKWEKSTSENPANIIFNDGGSSQSSTMSYFNGGYYNAAEIITIITEVLLNSTNFPDANFRAALAEQLNANEGDNIYPNNVKVLNVSNKGISNLTGIAHFTNLEELYAQDNNITSSSSSSNINVSSNTKLKILNVSNNSSLTHIAGIANCHVLEELYLDGIDFWPGRQISTSTTANVLSASNNPALKILSLSNARLQSSFTMPSFPVLEYLNMSDNSIFNGFSGNLNLPKLKTLIFRNLNLASDALNATHFTNVGGLNLKYLDVSDNPRLYNLSLSGKTNLETLIMKNCAAYDWGTLNYCPDLKHVDLSGCTGMISSMWDHLNGTNHTKLRYLNLSNGTTAVSGYSINFPALDTLIVTNHNTITELNITGHCPGYIDVTNSTPSSSQLRVMAINNCGISTMPSEIIGLMSNPKLYRFDLTDNQFTTVPEIACPSLTTMVMNNNLLTNIDAPSNVRYLYAQYNDFPTGEYVLETSLYGIDLGGNGFTKFKAIGNPNLKALALGNSPSLTEIELHENPLLTQTSPDGEIETDNGLYIKGLSNLKVLNIENSKFNKLGQQNSLEGVTALETLKARHNELTTFTNGVYELHTSSTDAVNYRKPDPTQSSLEYQTNLKYLDLSHNLLRDSVHLYRNTALTHLDVSYNRSIDGQLDPAAEPLPKTAEQKAAILEQKGRRWMKYGKVGGKTYGVNASAAQWTTHYTNLQAGRLRPFDLRKSEAVCDLNDTTGLYHLDLGKNVNLEWLDISYTNIHNTSAGPTHMNPGWMDKDWVTDDNLSASNVTGKNTTGRWYSSWHTFVYFIPCTKLKVIHADHNNMRSLGVRYFPELDTLTCSYMYGDSELMRDYSGSGDLLYGMGNTGAQTSIKKFNKVKWNDLDDDGYPKIELIGPGGTTAASDVYPNKLRYWDLSYSGYNEVRLYPGSYATDLPYLEYVNVSGNPLNFTTHASNENYATTSNYNSLDVTYCPNIRTVLAENCSDLPIIRAHNRAVLDTLYLSNDPKLKTLYVQNDPLLNDNFVGLNTLTGLETLFGYNNTQWGNDIKFSSNTALKNLWVSNIGASAIDVSHNTALEKLRAYDNSLTALSLSNNGELLWLDVARNKLPEIDLSGNTKLQFFNISNGSDTRTQLDGSEALNHDGSDGDNIKPTSVFNANEAPIANANDGNSLSDLALPASIIDARANGNDLHSITGNFANLTNIEFAHNHINGIDLSAAPGATIESRDNGRTIVADCAAFSKKVNGSVQEFKVYFFQLDPNVTGNGTVLTLKDSEDLKGDTRHLGADGMVMNNITWDGTSGSALKNTITPGDMSVLDPDEVPGNIVVLNPTSESGNGAEGTATYTYKTGENSTSEFYLNWSSDGTVTGINEIKAEGGVSITDTYGNLTVAGADGVVVGVYDLNGRQVASETITDGKAVITGLTPGIYIVNGMKVLVK